MGWWVTGLVPKRCELIETGSIEESVGKKVQNIGFY
jgi:hypothetical protein